MYHKNRIIELEGALNVRELGGLPLRNGRKVKSGKLIRSGRLSNLTDIDQKILRDEWNVTTIVDLRNEQEILEHPNVKLDGAVFKNICLLEGEKNGISREEYGMTLSTLAITRAKSLREDGGSRKLLESMYGQMAENQSCIRGIREFFDLLEAQRDGAFLWHCTSGKDRTGVLCVLLLYLLDADMETIKADYLYTNEQNQQYRENLLVRMKNRGAEDDLIEEMRILESVDWIYIESFLNTIIERYGSIDLFFAKRIGMTKERAAHLQDLYTEV